MDKKDKILDVAEMLFSEYGYNGISMRDIADSLDMSVGNLTYHFKKKEDLVVAVVIRQHESYTMTSVKGTLAELDEILRAILLYTRSKGYYFRNYKHFSLVSEKIHAMQTETMHNLYHIFLETFQELNKHQLIKSEELPDQYSNTVQSVLSILFYGVPRFELDVPKYDNRLACLWTIIYPLLTEDGVNAYKVLKEEQQRDRGE